MLNWTIGLIAVSFWIAATLLYMRGPIGRAFAAWRERREAAAKLRASQAKGE